jgi:hypothetical protein
MKILLFLIIASAQLRAAPLDSLPNFAQALYFAKAQNEFKGINSRRDRLAYDFAQKGDLVVIMFDGWMKQLPPKPKQRIFARLNQMSVDGQILRTLVGCFVEYGELQVHIVEPGYWKIALFREGEYCSGIEYDFQFHSLTDFTPINAFAHHQIICE